MFLVLFNGLDTTIKGRIITIDRQRQLRVEHRKRQGLLQRLLLSIDTNHIPFIATTTGHDYIFARITINELHFIPCRRHLFHKVNSPYRCICQIIGCEGEVLDTGLEEYCRCQSIDITRLTYCTMLIVGTITLIEG